jgi:hypothetical protein
MTDTSDVRATESNLTAVPTITYLVNTDYGPSIRSEC